MVIEGYVNYEVLGQWNEKVFTISAPHPNAKIHHKIDIYLPHGFWIEPVDDNKYKIGIYDLDGMSYFPDDIISSDGQDPIFRMKDRNGISKRTDNFKWEICK